MASMISPSAPQKPKLLDRVRLPMRASHYSRPVFLGKRRRRHLHESVVQRAVKETVRLASTPKPVTSPGKKPSRLMPTYSPT
jgi:hypothetical protein